MLTRAILRLATFAGASVVGAWCVSRIPLVRASSDVPLVRAVLRYAWHGETGMLDSPFFLRPMTCVLAEAVGGILLGWLATLLITREDERGLGYHVVSGVARTTLNVGAVLWTTLRVGVAILLVLLGARFMLLAGDAFDLFR